MEKEENHDSFKADSVGEIDEEVMVISSFSLLKNRISVKKFNVFFRYLTCFAFFDVSFCLIAIFYKEKDVTKGTDEIKKKKKLNIDKKRNT